jgi:predicted RNA-binding Zn-ribbon protein involved in translation (DUF1610 family)
MDTANFKHGDIRMQKCTKCGTDIEFWKDDVFLVCSRCGSRNTNAGVQNTCLAWCKDASSCIGNADIDEWLRVHKDGKRKH